MKFISSIFNKEIIKNVIPGKNCSQISYCSSFPCKNGATCTDIPTGFTCTCAQGYIGIYCDVDLGRSYFLNNQFIRVNCKTIRKENLVNIYKAKSLIISSKKELSLRTNFFLRRMLVQPLHKRCNLQELGWQLRMRLSTWILWNKLRVGLQ